MDSLSLEQTVAHSRRLIEKRAGAIQVSINALKIGLAHEDVHFKAMLGSFTLASADGVPVVWAARLLGRPIPGRVNGTDLMFELVALAEHEERSVYLLGARESVLEAAIARLRAEHPRLRIAGSQHGYFEPEEEAQVVERVAEAGPDILFVALPTPRKEWFLVRNAERLGAAFAMGVGGSIDVLAGVHPRAPRWMQRIGLEWAFRLLRDPSEMWRRYLRTNAQFVAILANEVVRSRHAGPRHR